MRTKLIIAASLSVAALSLSGCAEVSSILSGGVTIDSAKVEENIADTYWENDAIFVVVDCPEPFVAKPGESRNCLVTAEDGSTAMAKVTVENSAGDITWVAE
jgi:hypothetical protein